MEAAGEPPEILYEDEDLISTRIEIHYANAEGKEKLLEKEVMAENGDTMLADLMITRKDTGKQMSAKMAVTPKFHFFGKITREMNLC